MNIKKSMISVATAALLVAGFAGCDTSSESKDQSTSTTTNSGLTTQISTPKGSVSGTVMDTNGNPLSGVNVYLAGQTAVTDAGGIYNFADVPVTTTSTDGKNNANATNQTLSVTIAAPEGYLGATVTVTPTAQLDHSNDSNAFNGTATTTGAESLSNTTFVDGYIASAGTAVLPSIGATVTGKLELATAETAIANQEITLDFLNASNATGANIYAQNGVITTYATGSYKATTDANGMFTFTNVPADSDLTYIVPNYTVNGEQTPQGTNAVTVTTNGETSTTNIGDLQVTAVVNNDKTAPYVISTVGEIGNTSARQMLEDDVRKTIVINFSEAMNIEVDKDYTSSVIVKAGTSATTMTDRTATATATASGLTVVLDTPLADNEFLDINLLISDFKDTAGNFLGLGALAGTPNVAYDSVVGQVVKLQYQGYNDLNTEAKAVTAISQNTIDANGATNDAATLQAMNNAFNDVVDSNTPDNTISQMNATESNARLAALGTSALGAAVTMNSDVARITFTPSGAAAYNIKATRSGADINLPLVAVQNGTTVATVAAGTNNPNGTTTDLLTPVSASDLNPVEFVIPSAAVKIGDIVTITPIDDLGYVGTATTITLADNVAPTTILQKSYGLGNSSNGASTVVKFGDSGELSDTSGTVTVGTPYLAITAGLLDNKKADGTAVNGVTASDNKLTKELYALNTINSASSNAYIAETNGIYDTTAWASFNTDAKLTRTVGVAFSENIDLNGTTPVTTNISSTLSAWTVNNDVKVNDDTGVVVSDLVDFTTSNVLTLANTDSLGVIDFTGIKDTATTPNVATAASNAKVVVLDKMPPFVTEASFDGTSVIIKFNEPMKALAAGETISITSSTLTTRTATYAVANASKYVFSSDKKTLTIAATEFAGLTKTDFDIGAPYVENAYGTVARTHAALTWTLADANGNDWAAENAGVIAPKFAIAELIGEFTHTTSSSAFLVAENTTTNSQKVIWTFAHPIKNDAAGEILNGVVANASGNYVWDGSVAADLANIQAWFETTTGAGGATETITQVAGAESTSLVLDSTKKVLTLTFTTTTDADAKTDAVRMKAGQVITSATDNTQTVNGNTLSASAQ